MKIAMYDRVLLQDGSHASVVEIFDNGQAFLADVDRDGDTYTDEISIADIVKVIEKE